MQKFIINGKTVREQILDLATRGNQSFVASLHPGIDHVLGVRVPDLRRLAKEIAKSDWKLYLDTTDFFYMEERMLYGLVLGYIKPDNGLEDYLSLVSRFVSLINCWSVCDCFAFSGGKKFVEAHQERLWNYIKGWMHAEAEYAVRFGVVMSLKYFIDQKHIDELFSLLKGIKRDEYYVKMAIAWALSVCYISFPQPTMTVLKDPELNEITLRMTLQKIIDSYRVPSEEKKRIRKFKCLRFQKFTEE